MELKVESEKVLEAAKQHPDVKRALKTMFSEAFEENRDKHFDLSPLGDSNGFLFSNLTAKAIGLGDKYFLKVADVFTMHPGLHKKSFYLHGGLINWELRSTPPDNSYYLLIPTRKDCKESGE
ncbi:hypothetical protein LCGC14_0739560 [marine sediment metagenome]|uniref:Uncharacterized protein n=1 Tax=marine sediment metagenome TaxID=412755 RepID=A0A0F9QBF4_9ZZZZ